MRRCAPHLLLLAVAAVLSCTAAARAGSIRSSFDSGVEGWTANGDGKSPVWTASGGVTGGYISVTDGAAGSIWHFIAPAQYLGNRIRAYNQTLTYSIKVSTLVNQVSSSEDVRLTGGGTTLVLDTTPNPGMDWTSYLVILNEAAGWKVGTSTGSDATREQIMAVLSSLTQIAIRGEFSTLVDTGSVDDVVMTLSDPIPPTIPIVSTFDANDEGWRVMGDAQNGSATPTYLDTGGNPGGNLKVVDNATGDVWYWLAPEKFIGNVSAAMGGTLSFDLKQSSTDNPFDSPDVQLVGASGALDFRHAYDPGTGWTHFEVPLVADGRWVWAGTSTAVTNAELLAVLGDLLDLRIRGEFRTGTDTDWLDNVRLSSTASLYGDVTGDDFVNIADVIAALRGGSGSEFPGSVVRGDVAPKPSAEPSGFGDRRVDALDAVRILRRLFGVEPVWP